MFIHIYKTAGTSVSQLLVPYARPIDRLVYDYKLSKRFFILINKLLKLQDLGNQKFTGFHKHEKSQIVYDVLGDDLWNEYFSFAFVRNPFDWLTSFYFFIKQSKNHIYYSQSQKYNFIDFANWYIDECYPATQFDFVKDEDNEILVKAIYKFENISYDIVKVCKEIGIPQSPIKKLNKSNQKDRDYRSYYNDRLVEKVLEYFMNDFNHFNYSFEN